MMKPTKAQVLQALDDREDGLPISADMRAALLEYDQVQMSTQGLERERFLLNQKNASFEVKLEQLVKRSKAEGLTPKERQKAWLELIQLFPEVP